MPAMTITDVYDYIINQPKSEASFQPIIEIGQIDVPENFIRNVINQRTFEDKFVFGQPGKVWNGASEWSLYVATPRGVDWVDPDFININNQTLEKVRVFASDFEIASASVFSLGPGGYIVPHIDRPGNPNELYMPFNWPDGMHMGWKNYGEIHPICNTVYAFDTSKEHAIVNMSNEMRYVYIISPKDTETLKPLFITSNSISS